jgi:poly(3-hydroxybutyrate) depolymerase
MKTLLLVFVSILAGLNLSYSQNVFNPADPIVRYSSAAAYGSAQRPDTNKTGLQKWVSTATSGVSTGSSAWDASSYKAYFLNIGGNKMSFRVKFPKTYTTDATKRYPAMVFLHGAGEVSCASNNGYYNNEKQLQHGGKLFSDAANGTQFDGFLVYPQLLARSGCWDAWGSAPNNRLTIIISLIDSLVKYARLDVDRLFVNGLSGGGYGAWKMAAILPQRVATIAPSAAAGSTSSRDLFVHIPIWFATGGKDPDPSPAQADYALNRMKEIGADIRYTRYPDLGHAVWYTHWREPDYFTFMNQTHKANPLVFFQRYEFCEGQTVNAKLGITAGFYAYEWQKDGITIATRTNGVNTIVNGASVVSYTGNDITIKSFGTYRVRFRRTSSAAWSEWSPRPAVIGAKPPTNAVAITVSGLASKVLPALDGKTTVPLQMPEGFTNYQWVKSSDNSVVATTRIYEAPIGVYKAKYNDQFGCPYGFSPDFTVIDAAGTPKPVAATNLAVTALSLTSNRLNWTQGTGETNFEIYRATTAGGPYTLIAIANANATTYTDNINLDPNATYYYIVRAINNTGAAAKSNEASANAGNTAPVIGTINDMYVKSDATAQMDFTITDNPADVVTTNIPAKPGFVSLTKLSGFDYRISLAPTKDDIGFTTIEIVATDNYGKQARKKFTILVGDKNTRSVFVNFGSTGKTAPAPWNNWLGTRAANSVISNLKDESQLTTGISVTAVNSWSGVTDLGLITGNDNGVFPDAVLQSGIADNGAAKQFRIAGLNTSKLYNLAFVGSQNEGLIATSSYAANGQLAIMDSRYNSNRTTNLNSLVPDAAGTILVTITRTGGSLFTYLNGLMIEEYDPSITLLPPSNLYVEPADRTVVNVSWSDKTNNEAATSGYELQRATNAAFTSGLVTIALAGNTTSYRNTGLAANTKYFYRVRAKNGTNVSEYSNVMSTITPGTIVYVNFNTTVAGGPSPWNNLAASSVTTFTKSSLKNQSGTSTTMALRLDKFFNGEFTAGKSTGNNSGIVPDNVLKSAWWVDRSQLAQMRLSGLNTARRYRIGFFGSSSANGWFKGNYTATYTVNGRTVYLNSWENSTKVVYIGDLVPLSGGILYLDFNTTANAAYGFNSGIIIQEYTDSIGGIVTNSVLDTAGANLVDAMPADYNIHVYPNPYQDIINIDFFNKSTGDDITAEVYDLSGRLILRKEYRTLPAGANTLRLTDISSTKATSVNLVALKVNGRIVKTATVMRRTGR